MTEEMLQALVRQLGSDLLGVAPAAEYPRVPRWSRLTIVLAMLALEAAWDLELYLESGGQQIWGKWAWERIVANSCRVAGVRSELAIGGRH